MSCSVLLEKMDVYIVWKITTSHYGGVAVDEPEIAGIYADPDDAKEASKDLGDAAGAIECYEVKTKYVRR